MIFVRDKGRMCNNILQYAHLYAWGREHHRATLSMRFAYKYRYFHICDTPHHSMVWYLMGKYGAKLHLLPVVTFPLHEGDTTQQEQALLRHRHCVAEGWGVRFYDLFLKYKQEIIRLFAFHDDVEATVARRMRDAEGAASSGTGAVIRLGVHIRRGDYATWQGGRYLYTDEQYLSIIRQAVALNTDRRVMVYICGNDPQLNRQLYVDALGAENVCFPDGNPGEDLCLLSHCDALIGAPSTFTLVASMYRDTPLYWIEDPDILLSPQSFSCFDELFRRIH